MLVLEPETGVQIEPKLYLLVSIHTRALWVGLCGSWWFHQSSNMTESLSLFFFFFLMQPQALTTFIKHLENTQIL